jgi:hypothetical protein
MARVRSRVVKHNWKRLFHKESRKGRISLLYHKCTSTVENVQQDLLEFRDRAVVIIKAMESNVPRFRITHRNLIERLESGMFKQQQEFDRFRGTCSAHLGNLYKMRFDCDEYEADVFHHIMTVYEETRAELVTFRANVKANNSLVEKHYFAALIKMMKGQNHL